VLQGSLVILLYAKNGSSWIWRGLALAGFRIVLNLLSYKLENFNSLIQNYIYIYIKYIRVTPIKKQKKNT
jgi:hypothetical protein